MNHIMIDAYQASESRLDSLMAVNSVFNEIVRTLNLKAVMPPFLLPFYYAKDSEDDGISAFVILQGGHITIHTFPRRRCLFVDLLYDGYYDENDLKSVLENNFSCVIENSIRTERRYFDSTIDEERIFKSGDDQGDFGPHTIATIENLDITLEKIYDMLDELPRKINMLPISRPYVLKSNLNNPQYISGVVLIAQSHIAFHYCIADKTLFCDAFSCSFYRIDNFVEYLKDKFGDMFNMTIIRGSQHVDKVFSRESKVKEHSRWLNNSVKGN